MAHKPISSLLSLTADEREVAAAAMTDAATAWLSSLTIDQLPLAAYGSPLDPGAEVERLRWYYTPTHHGGLALGDQRPAQQSLAMQVVATGLSTAGYATVAAIMGLENILDQVEGWGVHWGRDRGRDPGLYWLRIFGIPGDRVWAWRFGGHHISLNNLIMDDRLVSTTPCFIGADPARTELLGGVLRPLQGAEDTARRLVRTLDAAQREAALLHPAAVSDIVSGNRPRISHGDAMMHMQDLWRGQFSDRDLDRLVEEIDRRAELGSGYTEADHARVAITIPPHGVSAGDLDVEQRRLLRELIACYTGRAPNELARAYTAHYGTEAVLDRIHFAWAGSTDAFQPHYYRIQGPDILAEYDNTQRRANHAHSVWRDPLTDFGLDALADHHARTVHD